MEHGEPECGHHGECACLHLCTLAGSAHRPLIQANIYELPLVEESFDYLLCLGVIQHTPDVQRTFKTLFHYLRPGGRFCVDVYAAPVAYPLPLSTMLGSTPVLGQYVTRLVPVANRMHLGLKGDATAWLWSVLDTFDWLAPPHEKPQTRRRLQQWATDLGLREFSIERHRGLYVIRGVK
ncbi:class I SAM-dependent methyltransferase [Nonomuraea sp. NPDC049269]|uniref:class I SAM-dependent methyltransferase n=1 Tax=Nonomuraea sp. NPDC049269 TaxID=3364349 RepID=UPI003715E611